MTRATHIWLVAAPVEIVRFFLQILTISVGWVGIAFGLVFLEIQRGFVRLDTMLAKVKGKHDE